MKKLKVFEVRFFIQSGLALGGKSQQETISANTAKEAERKLKKKYGTVLRLTSVKEIGSQG